MVARLLAAAMRPGRVAWIGLRPARRAPLVPVEQAALETGAGLVGDRYAGRSGRREVTLIGAADLAAIAEHLGLDRIEPARLRRNLVTHGINLLALKGRSVRLGTATLEITGPCDPCSRMEEEFGTGGYNAVRSHGGVTARVVVSGIVRVGDPVVRI